MRDIKFRGFTVNEEKFNNGKDGWIYGNLSVLDDGTVDIQDINDENWFKAVNPESVGQYTGLHDKNGKEIYEGDIIEFSYDMFVGNFDTFVAKDKVVFEEGAFYVEVFENERTTEGEAYLLYSINLDTIEVIGNTYENKELLDETNR